MKSNLKIQLEKLTDIMPGLDSEYWYERLTTHPEGEWFIPDNKEHQDFQTCFELAAHHLIEKRNEPIWFENSFRGQRIYFRYKLNLLYNEWN